MSLKDQILTVEEVAEILRVTPRTVAEWSRAGDLPGFKMGRNWLFFEDDLLEHLASRAGTGVSRVR